MKQYIGISRDHSGSMAHLARLAARDYNDNVTVIKEQALAQNIDTVISVVKCGVGAHGDVVREVTNSSINAVSLLAENAYKADGSYTPLFDSVGDLIETLSAVPDAKEDGVSFLVMAVTDGQNNRCINWTGQRLASKIRELQVTDRWTFVFRVPKGYARELERLGIAPGNILEWEQTNKGVETSSIATRDAFTNYYKSRATGERSTKSFYANLSNVTVADVKAALVDISNDVVVWPVFALDHGRQIQQFVEGHTGRPLVKGTAFYQLTKTEKEVQDYKIIVIRERATGKMYSGAAARQLLGLPTRGTCRVVPGDFGAYDVFIQSTSLNRKLVEGSSILLYTKAAV